MYERILLDGAGPESSGMFEVEFTRKAVDDLRRLRKYDQKMILSAVEAQLQDQADQQTRHRKRLRPNQLAEWELRVGDFRVFYDVDSDNGLVKVIAIGEKKGNQLFVSGEEYEL